MTDLYPEQKLAIFLLASHVEASVDGWSGVLNRTALRSNLLEAASSDGSNYMPDEVRTSSVLSDEEKRIVAENERVGAVRDISERLEQLGMSKSEIKKLRESVNE